MGIISRIFASEVTDLENPALWLREWARGRKTLSGQTVNHETAMSLSAWYAAIRNGSEDIAKLPRSLRKKRPQGQRGSDEVLRHPVNRLMAKQWTPTISAFVGVRTTQARAMGWGNGHAEIVRDGMGRPIELWPIHPARMHAEMLDSGQVVYHWKPDGINQMKTLPARDVFHIQGLGDGVNGMSVLRAAADMLGLGMAAQEYGSRFFGEGAAKKMIAIVGEPMQAAARKELRKRIQGDTENDPAGRRQLPILEGDIKLEDFGISPADGQFLETRRFTVEECARYLRMSMSKLQDNTRAKGWSTTEAENTAYVNDFMGAWTIAWEMEVWLKLLTPVEQIDHFLKHNFNALLKGDSTTRGNLYQKRFMSGNLSPNDIRDFEDENPIDDPAADRYYIQGAMVPIEDAGKDAFNSQPAEPAAAVDARAERADLFNQQAEAFLCVFDDAALRMCLRETHRLSAAIKRHAKDQSAFRKWSRGFYEKHAQECVRALEPGAKALANMARGCGITVDGSPAVPTPSMALPHNLAEFAAEAPEHRAQVMATTAFEEVASAILEGDPDE